MKLKYKIIEPSDEKTFEGYFFLRWEVLRKPLDKPRGSERDELEEKSTHACAITESGEIIGVGRLDTIDKNTFQIRYMAVKPEHKNNGVGKRILCSLEEKAIAGGGQKMILHAREIAIDFYKKQGYVLKEKTHMLFGEIQHYLMEKHW